MSGYILTERRNFDSVADKILAADPDVLVALVVRYIYNANRVVIGVVSFHSFDHYIAQKTLGFFSMPPA